MPQRQPAKRDYFSEDTIAAIATATGGAIAMIRLSGKEAFSVLDRLAGTATRAGNRLEPRKLHRTRLRTPAGEELDDALFARFEAPASYTGEDVVELYLHGGQYIVTRVMECLLELGARQALPGEFSFRAVRNGKMNLSQAQAVSDLITASNDGAVSLALEKMSGTQARLIRDLAEGLRHLAVLAEAGIDFSDQDIDEISLPRLQNRLDSLILTLKRLQDSYDRGIRLQDGVSVAFVGLPNAGKSSFFNALLGEDRSIVSEIAGTTRDVVRERLTLRGQKATITLRLEDTAGLRSANDAIERIGIERSQRSAQNAELLLFLVDPASPRDEVLQQWSILGRPVSKTIGIFTKADLGNVQSPELEQRFRVLGIQTWVKTSAVTGSGISQAIEAITHFCEQWVRRDKGEVLLTRLDQLQAVKDALTHLIRAQTASEADLFAADIRQALHSLGPLIGETVPDDILGKIFSDFCIGK